MNAHSKITSEKDAPFDWSDPFLLEDQLTGEERMVRDSARDYCTDKLLPRVRDGFRTSSPQTSTIAPSNRTSGTVG